MSEDDIKTILEEYSPEEALAVLSSIMIEMYEASGSSNHFIFGMPQTNNMVILTDFEGVEKLPQIMQQFTDGLDSAANEIEHDINLHPQHKTPQ